MAGTAQPTVPGRNQDPRFRPGPRSRSTRRKRATCLPLPFSYVNGDVRSPGRGPLRRCRGFDVRGSARPGRHSPARHGRSPGCRRRGAGRAPAMTRIYALANQKGGVGKTTTTSEVWAQAWREAGLASSSSIATRRPVPRVAWGCPQDVVSSLYDVLIRRQSAVRRILPTPHRRLSLLPSAPTLAGLKVEMVALLGAGVPPAPRSRDGGCLHPRADRLPAEPGPSHGERDHP